MNERIHAATPIEECQHERLDDAGCADCLQSRDYIAGYNAARGQWIPIRTADDLPKGSGNFNWITETGMISASYFNRMTFNSQYYTERFKAYLPIPPYQPEAEK